MLGASLGALSRVGRRRLAPTDRCHRMGDCLLTGGSSSQSSGRVPSKLSKSFAAIAAAVFATAAATSPVYCTGVAKNQVEGTPGQARGLPRKYVTEKEEPVDGLPPAEAANPALSPTDPPLPDLVSDSDDEFGDGEHLSKGCVELNGDGLLQKQKKTHGIYYPGVWEYSFLHVYDQPLLERGETDLQHMLDVAAQQPDPREKPTTTSRQRIDLRESQILENPAAMPEDNRNTMGDIRKDQEGELRAQQSHLKAMAQQNGL